jgi:hypothetical protein
MGNSSPKPIETPAERLTRTNRQIGRHAIYLRYWATQCKIDVEVLAHLNNIINLVKPTTGFAKWRDRYKAGGFRKQQTLDVDKMQEYLLECEHSVINSVPRENERMRAQIRNIAVDAKNNLRAFGKTHAHRNNEMLHPTICKCWRERSTCKSHTWAKQQFESVPCVLPPTPPNSLVMRSISPSAPSALLLPPDSRECVFEVTEGSDDDEAMQLHRPPTYDEAMQLPPPHCFAIQ